ncbi:hypothetical protein KB553_09410 [Chryseobacterium rhizoplanae]|uniref:hypothetical protein n=1 Tax=Chryseobacterium rhizoplanae TaxID=1609531 RepID=UPI001CE3A443|nr:hypothetical protein [Chryseobacterium rhizoplanae]UCA61732.1 hypothetical protein KB553_09410 [Chryseobacterium rhizoplanae]
MIFKQLRENMDVKDTVFNELYPPNIKAVAEIHWTPDAVAKMAADYLAEKPGKKVLDIGAGQESFAW